MATRSSGVPSRRARDDAAHHGAHLVVGVGGGDHGGAVGGDREGGRGLRRGGLQTESREADCDLGVRLRASRRAGDDMGGGPLGHRPQQRSRVQGQALREVDDHRAQLVDGSRIGGDPGRSGRHEVLLVGPPRDEGGPHRPVDPHDVGRPGSGAGEDGEGGVGQVAQLAVGGDQGGLGGGVGGHRTEDARLVGEDLADGRRQDGDRDRAAALTGEGVGAQQLGQAVRREEGGAGQALAGGGDGPEGAPGQLAAHGDPDVVGGHHDGDGREGLPALGGGHHVAQGPGGRRAVADDVEVDGRHRPAP